MSNSLARLPDDVRAVIASHSDELDRSGGGVVILWRTPKGAWTVKLWSEQLTQRSQATV